MRADAGPGWRPIVDMTLVGGTTAALIASHVPDAFGSAGPAGAWGVLLAAYVLVVRRQRVAFALVFLVTPIVAIFPSAIATFVAEVVARLVVGGGGWEKPLHASSIFVGGAVEGLVLGSCATLAAAGDRDTAGYLALCACFGGVLAIAGYSLCEAMVSGRMLQPAMDPLYIVWIAGISPLLGWGMHRAGV